MHEFPDTSHSLIPRVNDLGDRAAWTEFQGIYQPVVLRMAGLAGADAQDVMQQVFLSISKSIEGWIPGDLQAPFRACLTMIVRNAITKALTRRPHDVASGSTSIVDLLETQPDPQATTAEILAEARKELIRWATEQIRSELSEVTWNAFWRTAIEGLPIAEVAKSTGRFRKTRLIRGFNCCMKVAWKRSDGHRKRCGTNSRRRHEPCSGSKPWKSEAVMRLPGITIEAQELFNLPARCYPPNLCCKWSKKQLHFHHR